MMMLRRWAVREQFVSGAYLWKYLSDSFQILHTTPLGGLVVPFGVYVDKIKNDRLSAIIHLNRPDIAEYHENRSR